MNNLTKEIVKNKLELLVQLSTEDSNINNLKKFIYKCYGVIAIASANEPEKNEAIEEINNNKVMYSMITGKVMFSWIATDMAKRSKFYIEEISKTPELENMAKSINNLVDSINYIKRLTNIESIEVNSITQLLEEKNNYVDRVGIIGRNEIDNNNGYQIEIDKDSETNFIDADEDYEYEEIESINQQEEYISNSSDIEVSYNDPEIISNTSRIMEVYRDLFEVGFELKIPYGILIKEGALTLDNNKNSKVTNTISLSRIYDIINDITDKYLVQSQVNEGIKSTKLRDIEMRKGTTYYPEFQLGNMYGLLKNTTVDSWDKLAVELKREVRDNISDNIKEERDIAQIVDALTTCIVISEFNANESLKLRMNVGNRLLHQGKFENQYNKRRNNILAGTGELYHIKTFPSGVIEVIIVFNKAAFNGRPLFAYEAVENQLKRGRMPSIKNFILGQDESGKIMTTNLDRQNASIVLIGAGQRSGKGVLTLNMLGTILAGGHPLVYLDGKPDMAPVLWDVARKNNIKAAAWDAFDSNGNLIGNGAPDLIQQDHSEIFGLLAYLKVLQLMILAANIRAVKGIPIGGEDKRPFFIFDEALAVQQALAGSWQGLISKAKSKDETEDTKWSKAVVEWVEKLANSLASTINSQLPKSGISTVWLFQAIQVTTWNQYKVQGLHNKFNLLLTPLMSRSSVKMLGRGTADSEYGLSKLTHVRSISERVLSDYGRHFAYTESQKINDEKAVKVFKPYLVLNTSDPRSKEVNELKNNVSSEVWEVISKNGELPHGAGFQGFAEMLGKEAIHNLILGREFLEEILNILGLKGNYQDIDEYIYDCSIESFISTGALLNSPEAGLNEPDNYSNSTNVYYNTEINSENEEEYNLNTDELNDNLVNRHTENRHTGNENVKDTIYDYENKLNNYEELEINNYIDNVNEISKAIKEENVIRIINNHDNTYKTEGIDGREVVINADNTKGYIKLTPENSIDCRETGKFINGTAESFLMKTPMGAQVYINMLWKSVLKGVVNSGYRPVNITTVALVGGNMFIGNKIVNLNGVLGGYEEIKLRDIISFKEMFKKFYRLKTLIIDEEMYRAALIEYSNIEIIFNKAKGLDRIILVKQDGSKSVIDKLKYRQNEKLKINLDNIEKSNKIKNKFDLYCETNGGHKWEENISSKNIWGMKLAKQSLSGAGKLFMDRDKPKYGRAIILTGAGITVGAIGTASWIAYKTANKLVNLATGNRG